MLLMVLIQEARREMLVHLIPDLAGIVIDYL